MAKVNDKIRPDAEKEVEKQEIKDEDIKAYYDLHKLDYLIPEEPAKDPKPENGEGENEDNNDEQSGEGSGSDPAPTPVSDDATETDATAPSKEKPADTTKEKPKEPAEQPAPEKPKMPEYKPIEEVKDEIIAAIKKQRLETAMNTARNKHLDELYDDLNDYVNEQRHIDVDTIAAETFKSASLGTMFGQLADFAAAMVKAAEKVEKLPDLKPFADKHDEVTLTKTKTYVNKKTALDADKIGGKPFANLLDRNYHEFDKYYAFSAMDPGTSKYMLSRITDGTRKDDEDPAYKFVFRIEDVREPKLLDFDKVKTEAPETYEKLLKDYDDKCIAEEADKKLENREKEIEAQIEKGEFDFAAEADKTVEAVKAYDEWKKNKDKEDKGENEDTEDKENMPGPGDTKSTDPTTEEDEDETEKEPEYKTTEYIDRTGRFPGTYTQEAVMQKVFDLAADEIALIRVKADEDAEYESLLLIRLHKSDDEKPVRRMSFKEFREMMTEGWAPDNNRTAEENKLRFEYYASKVKIAIPELSEEELEERRREAEDED